MNAKSSRKLWTKLADTHRLCCPDRQLLVKSDSLTKHPAQTVMAYRLNNDSQGEQVSSQPRGLSPESQRPAAQMLPHYPAGLRVPPNQPVSTL